MIEIFPSALRLSAPLLFASQGGLLAERSGVATICLEGAMIFGGWTAAATALATGNPWLGVLTGALAGALALALHALLTVNAKADAIISGVAVNLIAAGITPLLNKALFGSPTNTPSLPLEERLPSLPLVFLALVLPLVLHFFFRRTLPGLRVWAAGDGPEALEASGFSVAKMRWAAMLCGGFLAGIGGAFLSIAHASQFTRDMTAGRGFIALAALIFGKWRPLPTLGACLLFGLADAAQIQLQSTTIGSLTIPVQLVQALPYLVTLLVLVGFAGRSCPPRAIGTR